MPSASRNCRTPVSNIAVPFHLSATTSVHAGLGVRADAARDRMASARPGPHCDLPAAWDHLRLVFARSMGPPGLPVTGPPAGSARLCGSSDPERSDRLSYREVSVVEVQEVLRAWLSGAGGRPAAERAGVNVKTAR